MEQGVGGAGVQLGAKPPVDGIDTREEVMERVKLVQLNNQYRVIEELLEICFLPVGVGILEILNEEHLIQIVAQLDKFVIDDMRGNRVVPANAAFQVLNYKNKEEFDIVLDIVRTVCPIRAQGLPQNIHFDSLKVFLFVQYFAKMIISRPGMDVSWPKEENSGADFSLELPVSPRVYEPDLQSPRSGRRQSRSFVEQKVQIHFNLQRQFREFVRANFRLISVLCLDEIPVTYEDPQKEQSNSKEQSQKKKQPKLALRNIGQIRLGSRQIDRLYSYCQHIPQSDQGVGVRGGVGEQLQQLQQNGGESAKQLNDPIQILVQKRGGITIDEVVGELGGMDWQWGWVDRVGSRTVEDRTRGTLVLGQDELGLEGQLRIIGCRDIVVYALSSVSHVLIKACSGCTICIGAVGGIIRMEDCQKVELHVACRRILLNSCQQCTVYMGAQEKPVVLGDCRFLVVAPHNSPYEHLERHVLRAQISTSINKWDSVLYGRKIDGGSGLKSKPIASGPNSQQPLNHSLLPAEKFLPFYVPFRGSEGPLAGGASARTKTLQQPLFPLPNDYEKAMNRTMKTVEIIRERTKAARASDQRGLELQATIQQHFREWMIMTGRIKQIQDLAKLERDKIKKHESTEDSNQ